MKHLSSTRLFGSLFLCLVAIAPALAQQDGEFRDGSGNTIGYVKSDGEVRDSAGNKIGEVTSGGDVRNSSGNTIGSARGVKPESAAAFFFFFFKEM